jgi:hypothetical protein
MGLKLNVYETRYTRSGQSELFTYCKDKINRVNADPDLAF